MSSSYSIGDLVWAKLKGFCHWPGVISGPPPQLKNQKKSPSSHYVFFFGSNNYAIVKEENLKPYQEFKEAMTKNSKLNSFKHALEEIEKYIVNPNYHHINGTTNNVKVHNKPVKPPKVLAKSVKNNIIATSKNNKNSNNNRLVKTIVKNKKKVVAKKKIKQIVERKKDEILKSSVEKEHATKQNEQQNETQEQNEMQEPTILKNNDNKNKSFPVSKIPLCDIKVIVERNVFQCQTCNRIFSSNNKLNIHKRIHSKKVEKKPRKPRNHLKTKITKKPKIKIRLQMKNFSFKTTVSKGVKTSPLNTKKYVCPFCERIWSTESHLKAHVQLHKEGGLACHICGKSFTKGTNLNRHLKIHNAVKEHVCVECGKEFVFKQDLKRHSLVHSDVKPYACEYCEKFFKDKKNMKRHELTHLVVKV